MRVGEFSLYVVLALAAGPACSVDDPAALERSIGRVILESDRYPHGSHRVSEAIEQEYDKIRDFPESHRVRFFWSVLMNAPLDGSYFTELARLIAKDCPEAFKSEIRAFLSKPWEGGPPQPEADIARRTLATLDALSRAKK